MCLASRELALAGFTPNVLAIPRQFTWSCTEGRASQWLGLSPWVGKIPWRGKWLPTPVCLLENPMDQGSLTGLRSMGWQRVRHDWEAETTVAALKGKLGTCVIKRLVRGFRTTEFSCVDFPVTSVCQPREFSVILCQGWGFCALTVTSTVPVHTAVPRHTVGPQVSSHRLTLQDLNKNAPKLMHPVLQTVP